MARAWLEAEGKSLDIQGEVLCPAWMPVWMGSVLWALLGSMSATVAGDLRRMSHIAGTVLNDVVELLCIHSITAGLSRCDVCHAPRLAY